MSRGLLAEFYQLTFPPLLLPFLGSVFLLASHQALPPASPQVPSVVFTPWSFYGGQVTFGSPYVYSESADFL